MADKKFSITEFMAESAEDSAIYLYAVNTIEKRVLELALDNVYRAYLWHDWPIAQDVIERIYMADISGLLQKLIDAVKASNGSGQLSISGLGSGGCGCDSEKMLPMPEQTATGDYETLGNVPSYEEEDELLGAGGSDKCRKAWWAATWLETLLVTMGTPDPSITDAVLVNGMANRVISTNTLATAQKALPSSAPLLLDGVTGKVIGTVGGTPGTVVATTPRGGGLVGLFVWAFFEVSAYILRSQLATWAQSTAVVANIIGSATTSAELDKGLVDAGLKTGRLSVTRWLKSFSGAGLFSMAVGDFMGGLAWLWWVAIQRGWDWFPSAEALAAMFPSVSCSYSFGGVIITRYRGGIGGDGIIPTSSGGWLTNSNFDIIQGAGTVRRAHVWVANQRVKWDISDRTQETGTDNWEVWLYDYMPPISDAPPTDVQGWLIDRDADETYPPSYKFALSDYTSLHAIGDYPLRGYVMWVAQAESGGTLGFRVKK